MSRVEAPITPRVFAWARESAGYTVDQVAKRVNRPLEVVERWESGAAKPTYNQAKAAAEMFFRPTALLFLPEPPEERTLADFRTLPDGKAAPQGPRLRHFARRVVDRCEWAAAARLAEGGVPRAFVGTASVTDNPAELAARIRGQLGVHPGVLRKAGGNVDARRFLADKIREAGVFVFSTDYARAVPIEEMRGLAVCEPLAPAVAYNAADFGAAAQIFTLAHEMVHLWLGADGEGISNSTGRLPERAQGKRAQVERFCNRVAGEVLIPGEWIKSRWLPATGNDDESATKNAEKIARLLCVSPDAAARRAADCGLIKPDVYGRLHEKYNDEAIKNREIRRRDLKERGKELWLPRGKMLLSQSGRDFASLVLSAYYDGNIRPMEAAALLGAKRHEHVDAIAREILG